MSSRRPNHLHSPTPRHPQITIDGHPSTIWRHLPRQRPTGLHVREFHSEPAARPQTLPTLPRSPAHRSLGAGGTLSTLHVHIPRRLGPTGVALVPTGRQPGLELWTETDKFEIWPAQPVAPETQVATLTPCRNSLIHERVTGRRRASEAKLRRASSGGGP
jgi:hypothetical protein